MASNNELKKRALIVLERLQNKYPDSKCSLEYSTPHELLVATILSAQCTDARVNKVTPGLFKKYKNVQEFASADIQEMAKDIHSCGYHNQKARSIIGSSITIAEEHNGNTPSEMVELVALPGVGRKTANCVLGECFNVPSMVIDTHMIRIMNLLGFINNRDPKKIEIELMDLFPEKDWVNLTHMIIDHGRAVCVARRPDCQNCALLDVCPGASIQ